MIFLALNAVFAALFLLFARRAIPRGLLFVQHGWLLVQTEVSRANFRDNIESRRAISTGGMFLAGGLLWLGAGAASVVFAAGFALQAFRHLTAA